MTTTQYQNRQTVGTKLDLNMLRFQELPLIPRGGFHPKKEIHIQAYVKPYTAVPSSKEQIAAQRKKDRLARDATAKATLRWDARWKKLCHLEVLTTQVIGAALDLTRDGSAKCIVRWEKEGKIVFTGNIENLCKVWRVVK